MHWKRNQWKCKDLEEQECAMEGQIEVIEAHYEERDRGVQTQKRTSLRHWKENLWKYKDLEEMCEKYQDQC